MSQGSHFTEEHTMMRDQIRRFVVEQVRPHAASWEREGQVPRAVLKRMGELGLLGVRHPQRYGGAEMDTMASVVLAEELGRSGCGGFAVTVLVHTDMASPHLARYGTPEQLERYMPGIVSGELITAVAVTEPDAGSDVAGMRTRARFEGNAWTLNGAKMFITNGVNADLLFVAARTDPDAKCSRGITIFIVERDTPGFRVGRSLEKMGWHSSDTAELVFDDCRIPPENVLGEVNQGFYAIMRNFQNERIVLGAQAMGEAERAIELTVDYTRERKAFDGVLWDKQGIRQRLAQRAAEVEAGKQLVHHAAWLDSQGLDCVKEVSMVKAYCGELVNRVMYDCQQFHGGFGYMREAPIERMVRDARIHAVGGGATEVMLEEIAKRM